MFKPASIVPIEVANKLKLVSLSAKNLEISTKTEITLLVFDVVNDPAKSFGFAILGASNTVHTISDRGLAWMAGVRLRDQLVAVNGDLIPPSQPVAARRSP